MAKKHAKRALQGPPNNGQNKKTKISLITTPPPDGPLPPKTLYDVELTQDDLEVSIDTLNTLAETPSVIKSKDCKGLRTAVFNFRNACTTGLNATVDSSLISRIGGALADKDYLEARILLAEMRIRCQAPKLGALCRWVRDLDVVSGLHDRTHEIGAKGSTERTQLLEVLDAVLRATGPVDYTIEEHVAMDGPIVLRKDWNLRGTKPREQTYASVLDRSIFPTPCDITSRFRIIDTTPGPQRKPPNLHPAILYASENDAISLSTKAPRTTHHKHSNVPNLHLLKDVLTSEECRHIIGAAEVMGFTPDAPIRALGEQSSVLAHNFYWIVDTLFCAGLWKRVQSFVPAVFHGKHVRGLNRRFRVYRYVPGAEYRAHIDGAWPPSSIDPSTDKYIYDASPPHSKQSSLFTFLIYLNDEFEGGETTFFLPSAREGCMNAYPIKPVQGTVVLFPHGETEGSLLHEGTGVQQGSAPSAKYVIRTDVLYDFAPNSR
ncbi:uncharacterized protein A1O9_09399 [Exophiala aquamarina CBS 119918]|uniref:Fe2OG dioxygenase domain-containing protein n=1 Tax=Exophiala aquamarina CBS 119918 TaxID=1182545 RepID=A0A072P4P4_9EURO|nr:uncharacterized protein A1O9_09399 [Exophiala aquamarina CBS 119918]KEF54233.1 hypothetical protein A1O9_09399 [Exophiala aquamarina CBS 119918]